jgi:hypothetical protein
VKGTRGGISKSRPLRGEERVGVAEPDKRRERSREKGEEVRGS